MSAGPTLQALREAGLLDGMLEQAKAEYPSECCGLVIVGAEGALERIACENLQDALHARDPETYPRTSATAYSIDPRIIMERSDALCCIYHSHPDHGAYFSDEDQLVAAPFGEPNFPGVSYLVISVMEGEIGQVRMFRWSDDAEKFIDEAER